ncbi:LysR substrate-binding domain-containing protein [Ferrimonas sp.]|uniref:LysR substrate-binding domain-containing protein n=1 Tax=Ferrimonas sp. TaxID=2080861 RepID=UPI003A8CE50F
MDRLKSMQVFVTAAEQGSFAAAASAHAITATMVGKHIRSLEQHLQVRLINRTTRRQSLTESGQLYYAECQRLLRELQTAEQTLQQRSQTPMGTVKLNSPVTYGSRVLAPLLAGFLECHSRINVELTLENSLVDPFHHPADLVVRIGELADSSLIARPLGSYELIYCASPSYLARSGTPDTLASLSQHACLGFDFGRRRASQWGAPTAFDKGQARMVANSGDALLAAARAGAGVLFQPRLLVEEDLARGSLVQLLETQSPKPAPIHLLYRENEPPKRVRVLIDYLTEALSPKS